MKDFSDFRRTIYEKSMLYSPFIVALVCFLIGLGMRYYQLDRLIDDDLFYNHVLEFFLSILSILLTLIGLILALPDDGTKELLKQYGQFRIARYAISIGIFCATSGMFLSILGIFLAFQFYLFAALLAEVILLAIWLCRVVFKFYR